MSSYADRCTPPWCIGVDIGGTFTDLVLIDSTQAVIAHKTPSVPDDPAAGVLRAVSETAEKLGLSERSLLKGCRQFVHGSTIATNTLLERTGARVGLLTTSGFRDALEIRRGLRDNVWDHRTPWSDVLVPRYLRLPVDERVDKNGIVSSAVDRRSVEAAVETFQRHGVEAVAIAFLNSYMNVDNEHAARDLLGELMPGTPVTCSSDIAPVMGEYERGSTAVVNAYVGRSVVPYLERLDRQLQDKGLACPLRLVQSNGGVISLDQAGDRPFVLALSGPAAGVGSLKFFSEASASDNLISIEIGGTSCDVTVLQNGRVAETDQVKISDLLMLLPSVDIHTISAGGGTIAGVDDGGMLFAGPRGAGARPGPASYGFGGRDPTVTDAQLVLGRLAPGPYAGAAIDLKQDLAESAMQQAVSNPLSLTDERAAVGIIQLVEQRIKHAIEQVSVHRGLDVRDFTIVGAGGAGAMHAVSVARLLGCAKVYIPRNAGVFCAFGMCNADVRHDFVRTWGHELDDRSIGALEDLLGGLQGLAVERLGQDGFGDHEIRTEWGLGLRYVGQQWTVQIGVADHSLKASDIRSLFETEFRRLFDYTQPGGRIEVVDARVTGYGLIQALSMAERDAVTEPVSEPPRRRVYVDEEYGMLEAPVYSGASLLYGHSVTGPAVIEEDTTTVFLGAGDVLEVNPNSDFLIHVHLDGADKHAD